MPEGSLGRTAQDGHLDSHTAPELCDSLVTNFHFIEGEEVGGWKEVRPEGGGGGGGRGGGAQESYVHQHKKQDIVSAFGDFKVFTLLISCASDAFRFSNKGNSWDKFTQLSIQ